MDIYLAGSSHKGFNPWMQNRGYNKLMSYVYDKNSVKKWCEYEKEHGNKGSKLFIDSGAFTMWTRGKEINVDEYISWINEYSDYISLYGQIDSIPGDIKTGATQEQVQEAAEKTWENYLYMRPKMKNPDGLLYTFHVGEPYEFLEQALNWRDENGNKIKYMALGGMVGKPKPVKEDFLTRCYNMIHKSSNPNIKVHAFGMTSLDLLEKYPLTSADSTGWLMTAMTGSIFTNYGTVCLSERTEENTNNFVNLEEAKQKTVLNYIQQNGFTYEQLRTDRYDREKINAIYLHIWADKYIYKEPRARKTHLF